MADRLSDFIERSNAAKDTRQLVDLFSQSVSAYGYDRFMYAMMSEDPQHQWHNVPSIARNYPDDWMKYYVENAFMAIDPVREIAHHARRAFLWYEIPKHIDLSPKQHRCLHQGVEAGLHAGIGVPFHGPYGELAGIGLASSDRAHKAERSIVDKIAVTCYQFHTAYMSRSLEAVAQPVVHLTRRENEVLHWCAQGKSNWDISQILGVSENTVRYFVKQCAAKLGTTSKIETVLKAIRLSLIRP